MYRANRPLVAAPRPPDREVNHPLELDLKLVQERIGPLASAVSLEEIKRGFSADRKYRVVTGEGSVFLLRVNLLSDWPRKQDEFYILQQMQHYRVKSPRPICAGQLPDLQLCYYVVSYIEGEDAERSLAAYSQQVQFEIGAAAGRDLRRMHRHSAPPGIAPWRERLLRKHGRYVAAYRESGVTLRHADRVLAFIADHLRHIPFGTGVFQHDDFHVGNLIVCDGTYAGVIDFNRYDWGDPVHDLLKIGFFSRPVSIAFCNGQLHGYFADKRPSEHFWETYAVYVAMSVFASVVWTMKTVPDELDAMLERLNGVIEDHRRFTSAKPVWAE